MLNRYKLYLKTGNSVVSRHGELTGAKEGKAMARQVAIVLEMVQRYFPEAVQSPNFEINRIN